MSEHLDVETETNDLIIHIAKEDAQYQTWFNLLEDYDGFIIGIGSTRDESVADAVKTLETAINKLQEPPQ